MWNLVPEKDKRKFKIIETLYNAKEPITIRALAEKADCSVRVTKYDLEELKEELSFLDGKIISSPEGIILEFPVYLGLDYFQRQLFDTTPAFRFLENLFFMNLLAII